VDRKVSKVAESPEATEERFLQLLRRALKGWQDKAEADFSATSTAAELRSLETDAVYSQFGLASHGYVLIRLMGRMSISIGRRLGELYDNLPNFVAAARFDLSPDDVSAKIDGLRLDICIPFEKLSNHDREFAIATTRECLAVEGLWSNGDAPWHDAAGLGIEIRYNFNPNDSARLRKDVAMAEGLKKSNLIPVYLVYSGISPRAEAIARLRRAGWNFLIAEKASTFTEKLLGLDLTTLLQSRRVRSEIEERTSTIMSTIMHSTAMNNALAESGR
jgi:hypothetical protein